VSRIRLITLSLVAVFALSAMSASAASALEKYEFLHERKAVVNRSFTSTSGVSTLKAAGNTITCQKDENKNGAISATNDSKVEKVVVTFHECKGENPKKEKCNVNSPGEAAGSIKTKGLMGVLGESVKQVADKKVMDLEPESGKVFVELEGTCIVKTSVEGSVIGEVAPLCKSQATGMLVFSELNKEQEFTELELEGSEGTKAKNVLKAFGVQAIFISDDTITWGETVEVADLFSEPGKCEE
jgi:hypothetical protein